MLFFIQMKQQLSTIYFNVDKNKVWPISEFKNSISDHGTEINIIKLSKSKQKEKSLIVIDSF